MTPLKTVLNETAQLVQAEWLKLSRRPMTWILLIVFLVQMALFISVLFLSIALHDGIFTDGNSIALMPSQQIDQFRLQLSFPGIFGEVLGQINGLGGIFAVILAGAAVGSEYDWGTLRVQLARRPQRGRYLLAKVITLLFLILAGILIALVVGCVLALLYGSVLEHRGSVSMRDLLLLLPGIARALYVLLPYMLFAIVIATLARSAMAGIAAGIIFIVADASTGTPAILASIENPTLAFLYNLLVQQNVNTLVLLNRQSYGLDPSVFESIVEATKMPSPLQAVLVIGIYSLLFAGYAYVLLTRRDVGGAS